MAALNMARWLQAIHRMNICSTDSVVPIQYVLTHTTSKMLRFKKKIQTQSVHKKNFPSGDNLPHKKCVNCFKNEKLRIRQTLKMLKLKIGEQIPRQCIRRACDGQQAILQILSHKFYLQTLRQIIGTLKTLKEAGDHSAFRALSLSRFSGSARLDAVCVDAVWRYARESIYFGGPIVFRLVCFNGIT